MSGKKTALLLGIISLTLGLGSEGQDLCTFVHKKPVLSLEQMKHAELVDVLCELSGLKEHPEWPEDISGMTPEQYYEMEINMLVENGFPQIMLEIEPTRLVERMYFATLMFDIAMEIDEVFKEDCKEAVTETEQIECLVKHDYIFSKEERIYKEEILLILCDKRDELTVKPPPPPPIEIHEIYPEEFKDIVLEAPASPTE